MMNDNIINVGMGEYAVAHNPHILRIIGLGSCIGIALYARGHNCGALAHVMLPESTDYGTISGNPNKYADICIKNMLADFSRKYPLIKKSGLTVKLAGGAHMFMGIGGPTTLDIGKKNADAVKKILARENIRIISEDLGGTLGRTVEFNLTTGAFTVRTRDTVKEL